MHKLTAAIFLSLLLCGVAVAQLKMTREEDGLKGPVHTVQTITANLQKAYRKLFPGRLSGEISFITSSSLEAAHL